MKLIFNLIISLILFISLQLNAAQEKDIIQEEVNALLEYYNPTPERCRAALNRDISFPELPEVEFIFSCLLSGKRKIIMISFDELLEPPLTPEILQGIAQKYNIKEIKDIYYYAGILYTPEGERNALLMAKYFVNFETAHTKDNLNEALQGTLLGYQSEDIKFYYLLDSYIKGPGISKKLKRVEYHNWRKEDKLKLDEYEKSVWPNSEGYKIYQIDLQKTQDYLKENEKFSNEELMDQINQLKKSLEEGIE